MIGQIESYDPDTQAGVIKSEEKLFEFHADDWMADVPPEQGDDVNFDVVENKAGNVNLVGAYLEQPKAVKHRYLAAVLALILGGAGVHRFYLGNYKMGLMQLALTAVTHGYGLLWGFIDAVLLFSGHINKDAKGRPLK